MSDLIKHIVAINNEARLKNAADTGSYYGLLSEDESWWAEHGVFTVADYDRWGYEATISDLAKDAYGTRSACPDTSNMSFEELKSVYEGMCEDLEETTRQENAYQEQCVKEFEEAVSGTMETGNVDRETAVRWLRDAEQDEHAELDDSYFEYCNNLPYGYLKKAA